MKYIYYCASCNSEETITKSLADIDRIELCPTCVNTMRRELTVPGHSFKDQQDSIYQPAFGTRTRTNRDVKEQILRLNYEKGQRVEAVGDSEPSHTKRDTSYNGQDAAEFLRTTAREMDRRGIK